MSRKKKLLMNTFGGLFKQVVTVICGFILPSFMLRYYGSDVNGLVSSIAHFLSFISLMDLGVGAVIQANLYGPLAHNRTEDISKIVKASNSFFRKLALIFIVYILALALFLPQLITTRFDYIYIVTLLVILAISSLAQYLFGMTYQLLLNADQKAYIPSLLSAVTIVLNTVITIVLIKLGATIHVVKISTAVIYLIRPIGQYLYIKAHYHIEKKVSYTADTIKQKWNGFSQHLASVITQNIDVVVLTFFSTLENVSVYSVYYMVVSGIQQIIMTAATGIEALFGNLIANKEKEQLERVFTQIELIIHSVVTVLFTVTGITIIPFVAVYTKGVTDANYIVPAFGTLLVMAYAVQCLRIPYFRLIKAAGHFKETQNGAFISAIINVVITVALVFQFGLIGAALGTLAAMAYHTIYFVIYLKDNIIKRPVKFFLARLLVDISVVVVSTIVTIPIKINVVSYGSWIVYAGIVFLITCLVALAVNLLINRKDVLAIIKAKGNVK